MLSIKKLSSASLAVCILCLCYTSFAATESVECSTNTVFSDNECNVCYKESTAVTGTGTALEITDIKIPWKNTQTGISEVASEIANDIPKIISGHKIVTDPNTLDDLWTFTNPWTGIGEYVLAAGKETTLSELVPDGSVKIYGMGSTVPATLLVKSELNYLDRDVAKMKEGTSKIRNICLLYNLTFSASNRDSGKTATAGAPATTNTTTTPPPTTTAPAPAAAVNNPTTPPATNNTTTTTTNTTNGTTTAITPIQKPTTTPPTTVTTTTATTSQTTTPPTTVTPATTPATNTNANTTNTSTTTPTATTTNTTTPPNTTTTSPTNTTSTAPATTPQPVQTYTSPNIQLNAAGPQIAAAQTKVPTGPGENIFLLFFAVLLSGIIYWKKHKNSV